MKMTYTENVPESRVAPDASHHSAKREHYPILCGPMVVILALLALGLIDAILGSPL